MVKDTDQVCVIRVGLQHNTSLGPEFSIGTSLGLILNVGLVARLEGGKVLGSLSQLLLL